MGPTLNGRLWEVRKLEYHCNCILWVIIWDRNKVIDIVEWSICNGGQLEVIPHINDIYSEATLTDHLHKLITPLYRSLFLVDKVVTRPTVWLKSKPI